MEKRPRKAVTNEKNPKDHIGRGARKVNDEVNKGRVAKTPARQPSMKRPRKIETPGKAK
jgi:hypothetical protein